MKKKVSYKKKVFWQNFKNMQNNNQPVKQEPNVPHQVLDAPGVSARRVAPPTNPSPQTNVNSY